MHVLTGIATLPVGATRGAVEAIFGGIHKHKSRLLVVNYLRIAVCLATHMQLGIDISSAASRYEGLQVTPSFADLALVSLTSLSSKTDALRCFALCRGAAANIGSNVKTDRSFASVLTAHPSILHIRDRFSFPGKNSLAGVMPNGCFLGQRRQASDQSMAGNDFFQRAFN